MRELKFRAWDKENECWLNFGYASIYRKEDGEPDTIFKFDFSDNYVVEQYTGLIDKNGKEIYEGDIVKTNSPDRANFNAGAIVMQQQMYLIINTPTYGDARLSHSEPLGYYCDMECEIIGNIHENPGFLKKQVSELNDENLQLKSDVAYLKGKVEAYEWFLQTKGYMNGGENG